jgi:hypothetical protein
MLYFLWAAALISALSGLFLLLAGDRAVQNVNDLANLLVFDLEGKFNRFALYSRLMKRFSAFCEQIILEIDKPLLFSRRSLGLVLILAALYLFFKLYLISAG